MRRRREVLRPEEEVEGAGLGLAPSTPSSTSPMLSSGLPTIMTYPPPRTR